MSKREREDERPVTAIDLQATLQQYNRPTFVTFANANSNRFQYAVADPEGARGPWPLPSPQTSWQFFDVPSIA